MESLDYWRLCDELSVVQAAFLIVGCDPATGQEHVACWAAEHRPQGYDASMAALKHAILSNRLPATIKRETRERGWNEEPEDDETVERDTRNVQIIFNRNPDWSMTTIKLDDLRVWLRSRGISSGFFFPEGSGGAPYLNAQGPRYAPKLAAAIGAWEAVIEDPALSRGKTAKQTMVVWLRRNAARYGLTKEDGNPNEQGIEEIAKIANWDTKGGAPKTPGE